MNSKADIIAALTSKNNKFACAYAENIISESHETDTWYDCFYEFAALLNHSNSLVRNRALFILAANAQWDDENRFDDIMSEYLLHITDEKPITARQCIKALAEVGQAKSQLIPKILEALYDADLSCYKESMRSLIEKDINATIRMLKNPSLSSKLN